MINGLDSFLQNPDVSIYQIQEYLLAHKEEVFQLNSVCGQFKNIYKISDKYAVACINKLQGADIFKKEIALLAHLSAIGLPVIQYHGELFEIEEGHFAHIIDWINEATLLDSKDGDSTNSKLLALFLGVTIPSGEGWVLQKYKIESDIRAVLDNDAFTLEDLKEKAKKLHSALVEIQSKLTKNNFAICDLQLLVTPTCEVWLIDPQDIAKEDNLIPNKPTYTSFIDSAEQDNLDYKRQLSDGKLLLGKSIAWCKEVMLMQTQEQLLEFILKRPQVMPSAPGGSLFKQMMLTRPAIELSQVMQGQSASRSKTQSKPRSSLRRHMPVVFTQIQEPSTEDQLLEKLESMSDLSPAFEKENLPENHNAYIQDSLAAKGSSFQSILPQLDLHHAKMLRQQLHPDHNLSPKEPASMQMSPTGNLKNA